MVALAFDHLFLGLEPEQGRQRAKGFLGRDLHRIGDTGDDGRFKEQPPRSACRR